MIMKTALKRELLESAVEIYNLTTLSMMRVCASNKLQYSLFE